jgi:hypothetical protein
MALESTVLVITELPMLTCPAVRPVPRVYQTIVWSASRLIFVEAIVKWKTVVCLRAEGDRNERHSMRSAHRTSAGRLRTLCNLGVEETPRPE